MNVSKTTKLPFLSASLSTLLFAAPIVLLPQTGWSQTIEEVTVTARRREESAQDIPVSVTSFNQDQLEKQDITSTKDIAQLIPGVQFDQGFSAADTRISIRGINNSRGRASVATLIDGIDISGENVTAGGGGSLLNLNLLELERVEVIKGPQSALYGRNAFAGAINYVTKKPNMESTEINVAADLADYDTYTLRGSISGPVIENTLALSLNMATAGSDGYFNNHRTGEPTNSFGQPIDDGNKQDLNGYDNYGMRFAALWTPTENLDIEGTISYSHEESDPRAVVKVANANTFYLDGQRTGDTAPDFSFLGGQDYGQWLGTVGSVKERDIKMSRTGNGGSFDGSEDKRLFATLKVNWDIGATTLKSATSYLYNDAELEEDADFQNGIGTVFSGVGLSVANDYIDETDTTQITQDFTLESNDWDRGFWLVGAEYFYEKVENKDKSLGWYNDPAISFALPCGAGAGQFSCSYTDALAKGVPAKEIDRDTDSYSLYGMVSYDLTDRLKATAELRYIVDRIEVKTNTAIDRVSQYLLGYPVDLAGIAPQPIPLPQKDSQRTSALNPRFALDYKLTDDVMFYGSVAKGTKPAGYGTAQMSLPQIAKMDNETLWAYELGTKTTWFDSSLLANVAFFFNDYDDRQVGVTGTDPISGFPSSQIVNAGGAETKGVEVELQWLPIDYLTLGLGYAYTDAEWTDFNYSDIRPGGATDKDRAICQDPNGNCDNAEVSGIPENALTLVANWTQPLGSTDMEWFANANAAWNDERAVYDRVDTAYVDSYWRVDTQLGVQTERWSALVYVNNVFDDDTVTWGQGYQDFKDGMYGGAFGGEPRDEAVMAFLPDPRVIGVRGSYRFGGE